ncbi:sulfur carrier protein [Gammaproteobacteria bacterium]
MTIEILVNGKPKTLESASTVAELIESLGLTGRRIAVEINLEIAPRSLHTVRRLQPGDRVEIVHAIGGG